MLFIKIVQNEKDTATSRIRSKIAGIKSKSKQ